MSSQSPDTKIILKSPVRAPSAVPVDDAVLPFEVDALDLRGRLTRLGPTLDFILQTQTDGPVSFLIVDFQAPDRLRAYARYDANRLKGGQNSAILLGRGHLAMTIDQGADMSRYQGLVALDGGG